MSATSSDICAIVHIDFKEARDGNVRCCVVSAKACATLEGAVPVTASSQGMRPIFTVAEKLLVVIYCFFSDIFLAEFALNKQSIVLNPLRLTFSVFVCMCVFL